MNLVQACVVTTAALLVLAIWTYGIAGQSIREWYAAHRELRRDRRRRKAHQALVRDIDRESREWEERKIERDRERMEREQRRSAA